MVNSTTTAYNEVIRLDIHEIVRRLNSHLGATMVAALAGSRDSKLPYKWAKTTVPNNYAEQRIRLAHRLWRMVADAESDHIARAWFRGANPVLGETSPVLALREGHFADVVAAATAFVEGAWSA